MGEQAGHEFHGNQWTSVAATAIKNVEEGRSIGRGMGRDYRSPHGGDYLKKFKEGEWQSQQGLHDEIARQLNAAGYTPSKLTNARGETLRGHTVFTKAGHGEHKLTMRSLAVIPLYAAQGYKSSSEVRLEFKRDNYALNPPKAVR